YLCDTLLRLAEAEAYRPLWSSDILAELRRNVAEAGVPVDRVERRIANMSYGQAATWDSLGYAHHHLGHHTQALTCYQHALTLYRDLGDRYEEATTLTNLGDTHHAAGNPNAARTAWQQALTILDDLDHSNADTVRAKLHGLAAPRGDE